MKILVTGSGGYLGEQICLRLARHGHEVMAMYRTTYRPVLGGIENIFPVPADLMDPESLKQVVEGCEEVYHVAAFAKSWTKKPSLFYDINVGGTINLLNVAKSEGVKRIVVTSTAGAIGPASKGELVNEMQYRTVDFFGDYESSKFIMNERIQDYVRHGMDIRIVCPTRIFGPGNLDSKGSVMTQIFRSYLKGKWRFMIGDGGAMANYAFIDDVIEAHILAMKHGKSGEKYLIGSFNDSFKGVMQTFADQSGVHKKLIRIPYAFFYAYSYFIGIFARMFTFDPVLTKSWVDKLKMNWQADISKARKELGYTPTPKAEAIRKTIDWIKALEDE